MNNKTKCEEEAQALQHQIHILKNALLREKSKTEQLAMGIRYLNECAVESGNELDYEIEKSVFEDVVGLVSS